ncbi:hypothetical protein FACS1894180_0880 [Bacteroidia bacterium]|nr:hypothetical protein FACS1894180_0880 [Bacteroidia bacterium]
MYQGNQENLVKIKVQTKDHRGNNCAVADEYGGAVQQMQYYPYGMPFAINEDEIQPYKYNGKELDQMSGLNLYDYSARHYDPVITRFTTVDPHAERYYAVSPYAYAAGNPMNRIDPTGKDWFVNNENGNVFFIRGLSDLTKISNEDAERLTKYGYDLNNKDVYENLGSDDLITGFEMLSGYIPVSPYGENYSKQFMKESGFVPADKVSVQEQSTKMHAIEADGGMYYTDPIQSSHETNRITNSYVKKEDLYKKTSVKKDSDYGALSVTERTSYNIKVPVGSSYLPPNSKPDKSDQIQTIYQKSLDLIKSIVPLFF